MIVKLARAQDVPGILELAAQVEHWFGPLVRDAGFRAHPGKFVGRGTALAAVDGGDLLGGLLFSPKAPTYHVRWLVVGEAARGQGIGRANPPGSRP